MIHRCPKSKFDYLNNSSFWGKIFVKRL